MGENGKWNLWGRNCCCLGGEGGVDLRLSSKRNLDRRRNAPCPLCSLPLSVPTDAIVFVVRCHNWDQQLVPQTGAGSRRAELTTRICELGIT